jgi:hypothetical protein
VRRRDELAQRHFPGKVTSTASYSLKFCRLKNAVHILDPAREVGLFIGVERVTAFDGIANTAFN